MFQIKKIIAKKQDYILFSKCVILRGFRLSVSVVLEEQPGRGSLSSAFLSRIKCLPFKGFGDSGGQIHFSHFNLFCSAKWQTHVKLQDQNFILQFRDFFFIFFSFFFLFFSFSSDLGIFSTSRRWHVPYETAVLALLERVPPGSADRSFFLFFFFAPYP